MIDRPAIAETASAEEASSRWVLVVRPEPGERDAPFEVRVRRWLKCGLRGFGVRVVEVSSLTPDEQRERLREEVIALRAALAKMQRKASTS